MSKLNEKNAIKRVRFFDRQFLTSKEFNDEQSYHNTMRWLHNREFYTSGVVYGLDVTSIAYDPGGDGTNSKNKSKVRINVSEGMAIDNSGKEIIVPDGTILEHECSENLTITAQYNVYIKHDEINTDPSNFYEGVKGDFNTRTAEIPQIVIKPDNDSVNEDVVLISRLKYNQVENCWEFDNTAKRLVYPINTVEEAVELTFKNQSPKREDWPSVYSDDKKSLKIDADILKVNSLSASVSLSLNRKPLYINNNTEDYGGLCYEDKLGNIQINGPVLYAKTKGALSVSEGGSRKRAVLTWDNTGNVNLGEESGRLTLGNAGGVDTNDGTGYIGFNACRELSITNGKIGNCNWKFSLNATNKNNGGSIIYGQDCGTLVFAVKPKTSSDKHDSKSDAVLFGTSSKTHYKRMELLYTGENHIYGSKTVFWGDVTPGIAGSKLRLDVRGDIRINEGNIWFKSQDDICNGLGWYGDKRNFASRDIDGPVLFGHGGGALGTFDNTYSVALSWNKYGTVIIGNPCPDQKVWDDKNLWGGLYICQYPSHPDTKVISRLTLHNRGKDNKPHEWSFYTASCAGGWNGIAPNALEIWEYEGGVAKQGVSRFQILPGGDTNLAVNGGTVHVGTTPSSNTRSKQAKLYVQGKLHVDKGDISVKGDIYCNNIYPEGAKVGYVADQFINSMGDNLEEGDVVIIGSNQSSLYYGLYRNIPIPEVDLTDKAYDSRVCGIVCELFAEVLEPEDNAGKLNGNKKKNKKKRIVRQLTAKEIDAVGRTKVGSGQIGLMVTLGTFAHCKVDADLAPIEVGDLLVTSPTKGHAMKAEPKKTKPGMVLGKALGALSSGKGKIPVLVSFQ